jgi:hypothetical protein
MTPAASIPSPSLRALVAGLVDYAGLYPPAALPMADAVGEYARQLDLPEAWMLGRFVVPVARLAEFADVAAPLVATRAPWRISALAGDDPIADAAAIRSLNAAHAGRLRVDAVEGKASTPEQVVRASRAFGTDFALYLELPSGDEPRPLLEAVSLQGARAKIRTGGVTAGAFPTAAAIARFLQRCAELDVPFKATAGLHHPLRGEHRLTYEADAPRAAMFGFLNVFAAGAMATGGVAEAELIQVLEEREASAFAFPPDGLRWRHRFVPLEQLARARASFAMAFGSCSFREPVSDLQELSLL